ncbi:hypothetical protein S144_17 [Shewanella sp. phage 1/44]|uniref:hypothetical protein n=1 Tax=Shewanella sp. phage 1/44 TaxID=1458862 RepID=UPI0004F5E9C5|nr:hypothetical protein S144_17 [Shewanella sp. phage 1/44]AHK11731.1 hypothetical protein S144_17 [Shewanella sp. phage 1/44]
MVIIMIAKLIRRYKRYCHNKLYQYGWVHLPYGRKVRGRVNLNKGQLEFVLWKAGKNNHRVNYWYQCGLGHIFIGDDNDDTQKSEAI